MAKKSTKKSSVKNTHTENTPSEIVGTHGRIFEGFVTKKFPKRIVLEFERTVFIPKYERFYKKKTKLHARLPDAMVNDIQVGDYIKIRECRPISKIIHFIVIEKVRSGTAKEVKAK